MESKEEKSQLIQDWLSQISLTPSLTSSFLKEGWDDMRLIRKMEKADVKELQGIRRSDQLKICLWLKTEREKKKKKKGKKRQPRKKRKRKRGKKDKPSTTHKEGTTEAGKEKLRFVDYTELKEVRFLADGQFGIVFVVYLDEQKVAVK